MKLPDFSTHPQAKSILRRLGIETLPPLPELPPFTRKIERIAEQTVLNKEVLDRYKKLKEEAEKVTISDLLFDKNDLLIDANGQHYCAYIYDQTRYTFDIVSPRKFHLAKCNTMNGMKTKGKNANFYRTTRDDGFFPVLMFDYRAGKKVKIARLEMCEHCLSILKRSNVYFEPFTLKEFYANNQSAIPEYIQQTTKITEDVLFSPTEEELATAYAKILKYTCQACGRVCKSEKELELIEVNNSMQMLCKQCKQLEEESFVPNTPITVQTLQKTAISKQTSSKIEIKPTVKVQFDKQSIARAKIEELSNVNMKKIATYILDQNEKVQFETLLVLGLNVSELTVSLTMLVLGDVLKKYEGNYYEIAY